MENLTSTNHEKLLPVETRITDFSALPNTNHGLYVTNDQLFLINLETGDKEELTQFKEVARVQGISSDKFIVATYSSKAYVVNIFNPDNIEIENEYKIKVPTPDKLAADKNLETIVITSWESLVVVKDEAVKSKKFKTSMYALAVSPDGGMIATGDEKGISIYDASTLKVVKKYDTEVLPIRLSFSPDGSYLISGDDYAKVFSYELATDKVFQYENQMGSKPIYFGWLAEGNQFVVSFLSHSIGVYKLNEAEPSTLFELDQFATRYCQNADLISDNKMAICVEDLRTDHTVEGIPTSDIICILSLS